MASTEEENNINQTEKSSFFGRFLRLLAVFLLLLFLLSILLGMVVQDSDFQNWAVKKVTTNLSERLDTKVDLERIDLDFFNHLSFSNFYVEDYNKDTLLYTEELDVDLDINWRSLLKGRMSIDEITLSNGDVRIRRDSGQFQNNIQLLVEKLKSETVSKEQVKKRNINSFDLNLDKINLNDICFVQNDGLRGQDIKACLETAQIKFDEFRLDENLYNIGEIEVEGVDVDIYEYIRNEDLFNDWFYMPTESEEGGAGISSDSIAKPLVVTVRDFVVKSGKLDLKNIRKTKERQMPTSVLDYKNLNLSDINLHFKNLNYTEGTISGKLASLNVDEKCGFKIDDLYIDDLLVTERKVVAKKYKMKTPYSTFGSGLTLKYREFDDFWEFEDKIYITSDFKNTKIGVKDIIYLVGTLEQNEFLNLNINEFFSIDGRINGKINSLKGNDLNITLGDKLKFVGAFNTKNLAVKNEEYVDLKINQVDVSMLSLRQLIPNFALPPNFDKLGNLNFNGSFTGFINDFVAYGELQTDLGDITSDVSLELTQGIDKARYGGKLNLKDFDLATWTGDDKFGNVTISAIVKEGIGLRREVASANLIATVEDFSYKGYDYESVNLIGRLDKNEFDGDLSIEDEHISLDFGGKISFEGEKPLFNFKSNVRNVDFKKLNLSTKDLVLSGNADINVLGKSLSDIEGEIFLSDFNISMGDNLAYDLDTIAFRSIINNDDSKNFHLESELLNLDLEGQFDLDKISFAFQDYFVNKFPDYAERLEIFPSGKSYDEMNFDFDLNVFDSENLTYFLDTRIDTIRDMKATGYFNTIQDSLYLIAELPNFSFDNNRLANINILMEANEADSEIVIGVLHTQLKGGQYIPAYSLYANAVGEEIDFNFNLNDSTRERYDILINGILKVKKDKVFELSLLPSNLTFLQQEWDVTENNYIHFGKDFIEIDNFAFTNGYQKVHFHNIGKKGVRASLENFDLAEINKYTNYDKLFFDGDFALEVTAQDIFEQKEFELNLNMDTLKIFEDDWGVLSLNAKLPSLNDKLDAYLSLTKGDQQIIGEGFYMIPNNNPKKDGVFGSNYFDFDINSNAVPLNLLEYFIPSGLSNTVGLVDADVKLSGYPGDINSEGTLRVYEGAFDVDYLGTRYFVEDGTVQVTKTLLDGTGGIVKDRFGNEAVLVGGVYHTNLKDMILDLVIDAPKFLALETEKGDNELFYGIGIGRGKVKFTGPFNQTDINIDATTLEGTEMFIPIASSTEDSELGFINFVERKVETEKKEEEEEVELRGVNILLNLEVTDDVDTQIIFDEEAGDIVQARGRGNIEIQSKRTGEFSMYGNYEIEQGEYLFTYSYRDFVKVNKPFTVKRGGSISWNGDPYAAQINLTAEYTNLRTSVFNLIPEFLEGTVNTNLAVEARNTTAVDLSMVLSGDLFKPEIKFQLDFPELAGELKGFVDTKMLNLSKDENELNRQVFGLMVIGSFLPSQAAAIGSEDVVNFGVNTVSQFLSNQLSLYVSELLSDVLADNGVFTRAEFNVNYSVYSQGVNINNLNTNTGSELSLQVKNYLFKERLAIKIGTDIGIGVANVVNNVSAINTFDVIVEYVITKDRRFKLLVYNTNENTIFGPQRKSGFGASYRYEFDTIEEFIKGFRKKTREAIDSNI